MFMKFLKFTTIAIALFFVIVMIIPLSIDERSAEDQKAPIAGGIIVTSVQDNNQLWAVTLSLSNSAATAFGVKVWDAECWGKQDGKITLWGDLIPGAPNGPSCTVNSLSSTSITFRVPMSFPVEQVLGWRIKTQWQEQPNRVYRVSRWLTEEIPIVDRVLRVPNLSSGGSSFDYPDGFFDTQIVEPNDPPNDGPGSPGDSLDGSGGGHHR